MGKRMDVNEEYYWDGTYGYVRKDAQRKVQWREKGTLTPASLAAAVLGDMDNAIVASTPGGIEKQEAEGQQQFCNAEKTQLPIKIQHPDTRKTFEDMGIKFGKEIDNLFCEVELPSGWKVEATDHSMWNRLVDDKGKERASIFYKAAFYDQRAFMRTV